MASLASRMEVLEKENSTLKKKLIDSMDETATLKENVKALNADLRVERQLNLEKDDQQPKKSLKPLLLGPSKPSSKLRSTPQCSSVGISRVLTCRT